MDGSATTTSFKQFHVDQIAADMKESICRVSDGPFDAQENVNIPTVSYEVSPPAFLHPAAVSGIQGELLLPLDAAVLLVQISLDHACIVLSQTCCLLCFFVALCASSSTPLPHA